MSTERGNTSRTRAQKHQNKTKFKNNLHDTSHTTKFLNNLEVENVCSKCKGVIEWKIKYKKYKPLKAPSTCIKCHNKNVKFAYHTICTDCAKASKVCPKCGEAKELIQSTSTVTQEDLLKNREIQEMVKALSERRRRTFFRYVDKNKSCTEETAILKLKELSLSGTASTVDDFDDLDDLDNFDSDSDND